MARSNIFNPKIRPVRRAMGLNRSKRFILFHKVTSHAALSRDKMPYHTDIIKQSLTGTVLAQE